MITKSRLTQILDANNLAEEISSTVTPGPWEWFSSQSTYANGAIVVSSKGDRPVVADTARKEDANYIAYTKNYETTLVIKELAAALLEATNAIRDVENARIAFQKNPNAPLSQALSRAAEMLKTFDQAE